VENDVTGAVARTSYSTIPSGGQVSVRYLANPITRTGSPVTLDVLSSKRPDAPSVKYVVPTFSWSRSTDNRGIHSTKTGGTLRVYLDRPWWSSGQGELLGVVAWHGPTSANEATPNDMVTPYVTQFGNDPVHASNPVIDSVQVTDFPMAVATQLQTTVAELPTAVRFDSDMAVDVAGHEVGYDPTRDLWYCDIACAVGKTYWPYIRLALWRRSRTTPTSPGSSSPTSFRSPPTDSPPSPRAPPVRLS
jgi:hypothetical protein